jgi:signal transduction histidine kinase
VGRGLDNIAERAAAVDAELEIDSAPGHGTLVRIAVPLREE